jgi:NADH dehydrogenase/NADH:ubiquinone oxidoreductase subunit G
MVDGNPLEALAGQSVLQACLQAGIYIPNLCFMENQERPSASCRLCFVEIAGQPAPVTACTLPVVDGLRVRTDTDRVRRLQRSALKLLLSVHCVACKKCPANRSCGLQQVARFLGAGLNSKPLEQTLKPEAVDRSHPCIDHFPNRCVLCGKCIITCRDHSGQPALAFCRRGFDTVVRAFPAGGDVPPDCADCSRCIEICPVGALQLRTV